MASKDIVVGWVGKVGRLTRLLPISRIMVTSWTYSITPVRPLR